MERSLNMDGILDLTIVILAYNEEIHIRRCLENVSPIAKDVVVIDCFSTDRTQEICHEFNNVRVIEHSWPGNQAEQFNWALDNVEIKTSWILRLDADEYLSPELLKELKEKLPLLRDNISAVVLPLGRAFLGKVLKHEEVNWMIRLFRNKKAKYGDSLMDEHLHVLEGDIVRFNGKFIDDNLNDISFFLAKHVKYADREALQALMTEYLEETECEKGEYCDDVRIVKEKKKKYYKLPMFWRAFLYFCIRYFIKLSILDGKEGFLWCFYQGWWYRTVVDAKIMEIKRKCEYNKDKIIKYIEMNNVYKNK